MCCIHRLNSQHITDVQTLNADAHPVCRASGMKAPDDASFSSELKWRRTPGEAGFNASDPLTLPFPCKANPVLSDVERYVTPLTPVSGLHGACDVMGVISGALATAACC